MKTFNLLLAGAISFCFLSCSDDDSSSNNTAKKYAGTYTLTSAMLAGNVDFNQDGISSSNLMNESTCYNNSTITLKEDNTFVGQYNFVNITGEVTCDSDISSGTWSLEGNQLKLSNTIMTPALETIVTLQDNAIINVLANSQYPDRDADGNAIYSTGLVTLNYTKN